MGFINILEDKGLDDILYEVVYNTTPRYTNKNIVLDEISYAIDHNLPVKLITDPDIDGMFSLKSMKEAFDTIGFKNYNIQPYNNRDHKLNEEGLKDAVEGNYYLVIVFDTASSEIEKINKIVNSGSKLIILDHHRTPFTDYSNYPNNCYVINTTIENSVLGQDKYRFSAGALSFTIADALLNMYGISNKMLAVYALVTLYSDCMKISNIYNRAIYYTAVNSNIIPPSIEQFMERSDILGRRFIVFKFNSKINALFREERFDILNKMVMQDILDLEVLGQIKKIHESSRLLVSRMVDVADSCRIGKIHFSTVDLDKLSKAKIDTKHAANYTGLVANKFSDFYGIPSVVVCGSKGSLRDIGSRDMLSIFKKFVECGGHDSAFGIQVDDIDRLKQNVQIFCNSLDEVRQDDIIIDGDSLSEDDVTDMACYNEFTSSEFSPAYMRIPTHGFKKLYSEYYSLYSWGDYTIQSPRDITSDERYICVRPELARRRYLYYVDKR